MAENLVAARTILKTSMEKSKSLTFELDKTGSRLQHINQSLSSLQAAFRPDPSQKYVQDQVKLAICPAAAVMKIFYSVHELEQALSSHPCKTHLFSYLKIVKKLEEAMRFLAGNCRLAIHWLEGVIEFLEENTVANCQYLLNVRKLSELLVELQGTDQRARLTGGILFVALNKLENEFEAILIENGIASGKNPSIMLESCIQKLQAIFDSLNANGRINKCLAVYVESRVSLVRKSFLDLDLSFLEKPITEFDDVQDFEQDIDKWCKYFEVSVKEVFDHEFSLCKVVFKTESDISINCFAKIAVQSSIFSFLRFGRKVTECRKNPIKLLKLLDMFSTLENLRVDFNRLFIGKACIEIRTLTRDLIKRVVNSSCEIFWELPFQVELQRSSSPPSDGSVPKLVTFVTDYCNRLLGDRYLPILSQVLKIYGNWKNENYDLLNQVCSIIKEIGKNLDSWSQCHGDLSLSYIFMMNNHSHFHNLKSTKLGGMMGETWLRAHEHYRDYYAALYFRQSWGKLVAMLNQDGSPKRKTEAFNEAFDCVRKKHSGWVIVDESLREKLCQILMQTILPVYRNNLQDYGQLAEQNPKVVKYTPQALENMIQNLFKPKVKKSSSGKYTQWTHKIRNIMTDSHILALTAM